MQFTRLVTCGDSFTEGMCDEIIEGNYRGWADRVADVMSQQNPDFTYANFAIRGKLVGQVLTDQLPIALPFVTGPETLFIFHAGVNDAMRPSYKPEKVLPVYTQAVRQIAASGATILLFTVLEKTSGKGKASKLWEDRFNEFNANVHAVAREVGAIVADANDDELLGDRRYLAQDRLHLNPMGHERVAQGILEKLEMPCAPDWRIPLPPAEKIGAGAKFFDDTRWYLTFLGPWLLRRLTGTSSGDGRRAKHDMPIAWDAI